MNTPLTPPAPSTPRGDELLPCPFCGDTPAKPEYYQNEYGYHVVGHGPCGTHSGTRPASDPIGKQRVISAWNTRPAQAALSEEEAVQKLCKSLAWAIDLLEIVMQGQTGAAINTIHEEDLPRLKRALTSQNRGGR